jgi:catechol 2,3-dioxygenase-like lactoylglutathione lyase family enzyme
MPGSTSSRRKGDVVSLDNLNVGPVIPVSDLDASLEFYEGALGLSGEHVPGGYALDCGGDTRIFLLTGTGYAGRAEWPLASFATDRLEAVIDDLRSSGVAMEVFTDGEFRTDERGIADLDGIRIAWIRDPDNQVISIFEPTG